MEGERGGRKEFHLGMNKENRGIIDYLFNGSNLILPSNFTLRIQDDWKTFSDLNTKKFLMELQLGLRDGVLEKNR